MYKMSLRVSFVTFLLVLVFFSLTNASSKVHATDVVNPLRLYNYEDMENDIKLLAEKYPDIVSYKVIGKSEYGRNIYAVALGKGESTVFFNGSHHAREWLTTNLNMYMLDKYAQMYTSNQTFGGYPVKRILDQTKIWFVPMVNPDGVTLQQEGLNAFPVSLHSSLIKMNEGSNDFRRWKANAKGVDLNRQYPAHWDNIKNNFSYPRWSHHKGAAPISAVETKTIVNFTTQINPEIAVSYHSAGKILFWNFHQTGDWYKRDLEYAKKISSYTNYSLVYPGPNPSGGGYTDWFIIKYKRPAFTPEIGNYPGETNLPISEFTRTWEENKLVGLYVAQEGYKLFRERNPYPKLYINGNILNFDTPSLIKDGRTLVPLRGVFENLGSTITVDANNVITIKKDNHTIRLKIGSKEAYVNSEKVVLDVPANLINNRTMVPLRFIGESLGAKISWDEIGFKASIETGPVNQTETSSGHKVVNIVIDGVPQKYDQPAILKDNKTTMIPIRGALQGHNAEFKWLEHELTINSTNIRILLTHGSNVAILNGKEIPLEHSVMILNGRTLVPLRFISEALNGLVQWDSATNTVFITTTKNEEIVTSQNTVNSDSSGETNVLVEPSTEESSD
ncbi:stalk domain-containing protein [Bacillus pinisoli]|uniref:stalk domain-containing protein n=1 Tax=Bacillus pinisoli TaxID=2901866 RepID=UPI001FF6A6A9|nr:stalk domain-containing protein [Bacillus pinisoli]